MFSSYHLINNTAVKLNVLFLYHLPIIFLPIFKKTKLPPILWQYNFTKKFYIMHVQGFQYLNFTIKKELQLFFIQQKGGLISPFGNCEMTKHTLDEERKFSLYLRKYQMLVCL